MQGIIIAILIGIVVWQFVSILLIEKNSIKWRKDYFEARDEAVIHFNENLELKAKNKQLEEKINKCKSDEKIND